MIAFLKTHRTDLKYLTALLLIASIPLLGLRSIRTIAVWGPIYQLVVWSCLVGWLVVLRAWSRATSATISTEEASPAAPSRLRGVALVATLAVVVVVNFYLPVRQHFWTGGDDAIVLTQWPWWLWNHAMDQEHGRPLILLPVGLARLLTPGWIDGFLIVPGLLCLANGLLLGGIVRHFFRTDWLVPLTAATLLIVHPCDSGRFCALSVSNCYWMVVLFFLLAVRLYLVSHDRASRPLLAGACVALAAALLCHEGPFPLVALVPLLLGVSRRGRGRLVPWAFAWYGTTALLACRFLLHVLTDHQTYQAGMLARTNLTPSFLWENACIQFRALLSYFALPYKGVLRAYWIPCLVSGIAFGSACWLAAVRPRTDASFKKGVAGVALAGLAVVLGILPFLLILGTFRTQFLAGPGQAVLIACVLGAMLAWLPRRLGTGVGVACTACLVVNLTASAWDNQRRAAESPVSFDKVLDVLDQIHAVSPSYVPNTVVLFLLDTLETSPFSPNYSLECVTLAVLNRTLALQADFTRTPPERVFFTTRGIQTCRWFTDEQQHFGYDELVVYQMSAEGEVRLLRQIPEFLLPPGNRAGASYAPLLRMNPGPITPLRFFHRPSWMPPPHDVLDYRGGILFGANWGELKFREGKLVREARDGAELVVNPVGQRERRLTFVVDLAATSPPSRLEVLDDAGRVAATSEVGAAGAVEVSLPLNPERVQFFQLRFRGPDGLPASSFPVGRAGAKVPFHPKYRRKDINAGALVLGRNWHGLESGADGLPFRWVENDAVVVVAPFAAAAPAGALEVELEPGPSLGDAPCRVQLLDEAGEELGAVCVHGRETVRLPLPASRPGRSVRLHVRPGGVAIPGDPRVLHFRVFHCTLTAAEPH